MKVKTYKIDKIRVIVLQHMSGLNKFRINYLLPKWLFFNLFFLHFISIVWEKFEHGVIKLILNKIPILWIIRLKKRNENKNE